MIEIRKVEAIPLFCPEPNDGGKTRYYTLVRLEAADGSIGWGEARCHSARGEAALAVKLIVEKGFAPLIEGADPTRISRIIEDIENVAYWYGGGIAALALSGVEIALQDLRGKLLNKPAYMFLGGKLRDHVKACASMIFDMENLENTVALAKRFKKEGYNAVKFGWGRTPDRYFGQESARDLEVVRMLRDALGESIDLMVDVGLPAKWTPTHAIAMIKQLEKFKLLWVEEPLPPGDLTGYARVRRQSKTWIAGGEWEYNLAGIERLLDIEALDVVQPEVGRIGGIHVAKEAADLAARRNVMYSPHTWSTAINTAATLQILAATTNQLVCELMPERSPLNQDLVSKPFKQRNGLIEIPDSPGIGVEVNEDFLEAHTLS